MQVLGFDCETYSAANLSRVGAAAYAEHPTTGVHCAVLVLTDESGAALQTFHWTPGLVLPAWVVRHIEARRPVLAHNASFEASITKSVLGPQHGWPTIHTDQWLDTAATAASMSLPTSLAGIGAAIGAAIQKDDEGHTLMLSLATVEQNADGVWVTPAPTPAKLQRLVQYCELDVLSTICVWRRLAPPCRFELEVQRVDRAINARGVWLDQKFAAAARTIAQARAAQLGKEVCRVTEGEMLTATGTPVMKRWLKASGIELPTAVRVRADGKRTSTETLNAAAVEALLTCPDLDETVRKVLELRVEANKATSLAKLARVPEMVCEDGRLRYALQYCGAHTGRWSSGGLQLHNLPKSKLTADVAKALRQAVLDGSLAEAQRWSPNVLSGLSQLLRSVLAAKPWHHIIGADFSAIEARVLAWLAGQEDKVQVFRDFDATEGRPKAERMPFDPYVIAAAKSGSDNRQYGKVQELALGYGMGPVKFRDTAFGYGVRLTLREAAAGQRKWRKNNAQIVAFWKALEEAFFECIASPGAEVAVGRLRVVSSKACTRVYLPSGRALHYWRPSWTMVTRRIETVDDATGELVVKEVEMKELRFFTAASDRSTMDVDSTYGGKLAENITQAVSRDLLGAALVRLEPTIYSPVGHVHDSAFAEVHSSMGDVAEFCMIARAVPPWADGLPLAVEGYRAQHFHG